MGHSAPPSFLSQAQLGNTLQHPELLLSPFPQPHLETSPSPVSPPPGSLPGPRLPDLQCMLLVEGVPGFGPCLPEGALGLMKSTFTPSSRICWPRQCRAERRVLANWASMSTTNLELSNALVGGRGSSNGHSRTNKRGALPSCGLRNSKPLCTGTLLSGPCFPGLCPSVCRTAAPRTRSQTHFASGL